MEVIKLKEVLYYRKQFIEIDDDVMYKRCRVQLHRRGVIQRDAVLGREIKTKKQRVCTTNDFIVAEMDAKFGGYGIIPPILDGAVVSSHYYLYEIKKEKLLPGYLEVIIDSGHLQEQIKAVGSTNYSRVSAEEILEYEIPCPRIDVQKEIIGLYGKYKSSNIQLKSELTHQQTLLKKLRQQILQEAIEGKLTADWRAQNPDVEPASELLKRIAAEKAQLVQDKKIKAQKPLPPITDEEKPFELPQGWEWCRLGDMLESIQYGTSKKCTSDQSKETPILRIPNVSSGEVSTAELKYTALSEKEKLQYSLREGDLLIIRSNGSRDLVGRTAYVNEGFENFGFAGYLIRLRFLSEMTASRLVQLFLSSPFIRLSIENPMRTTVGINNINSAEISNLAVCIPPLEEQGEILRRVEMSTLLCDQLETQITQNLTHAEQLMQVVLKEAFSYSSEAEPAPTAKVGTHA